MAFSSTLGRSTIEMLINSNQYQVLCLKWAAGTKTAAAELRFSSKHLGYKGKSTGPKISLTLKRRLAGETLRSSGTAGTHLNQLAKRMGFGFQCHPHNHFHQTGSHVKFSNLCSPRTAGTFGIGPREASPTATHSKPMENRPCGTQVDLNPWKH